MWSAVGSSGKPWKTIGAGLGTPTGSLVVAVLHILRVVNVTTAVLPVHQ